MSTSRTTTQTTSDIGSIPITGGTGNQPPAPNRPTTPSASDEERELEEQLKRDRERLQRFKEKRKVEEEAKRKAEEEAARRVAEEKKQQEEAACYALTTTRPVPVPITRCHTSYPPPVPPLHLPKYHHAPPQVPPCTSPSIADIPTQTSFTPTGIQDPPNRQPL